MGEREMGTYVGKLREQRVDPRAKELEREGGPDAAKAVAPEVVKQVRDAFGGNAPAAQRAGAPGKLPLQVYADVYERGAALRLPTPFLAKHVSLFAHELGTLDKLNGHLKDVPVAQRAALERLPASVFEGLARGLDASDEKTRRSSVSQSLAVLTELAARPGLLNEAHLEASRALSEAAGELEADSGAALAAALRVVAAEPRADVLRSTTSELSGRAEALVQLWPHGERPHIFGLAAELALRGASNGPGDSRATVNELAKRDGLALTAEQRQLLESLHSGARGRAGEAAQQAAALEAAIAAESAHGRQAIAGRPPAEQEALAALGADVTKRLPADQLLLWHQGLNAVLAQPVEVVERLGRLDAELLARGGIHQAAELQAVGNAFLQLVALSGAAPWYVAAVAGKLALTLPPERLPGAFAVLGAIFGAVRRANQPLPDAASAEALAESLAPNTEAFAAANGPQALLVQALSRPGELATRNLLAREGGRFALPVSKAEPGPARDLENASFADDLKTLAESKLSPSLLADRHPVIPADALPRLLAMGARRGYPAEAWVSELADAFGFIGRSKEAVRDLRSLLLLADRDGADPRKLLQGLLEAKGKSLPRDRDFNRVVTALLHEDNLKVTPAQVDRAIEMLQRGENVAERIEGQLQAAMVQKLGLQLLLADANVHTTERGLKMASTELSQFFSLAASNIAGEQKQQVMMWTTRNGAMAQEPSPGIEKELLKSLLVAVLEDRSNDFRFTTPAAEKQLESLSVEQKRLWQADRTMNHVRFDAEGQATFDKRVEFTARVGGAVLERLIEAWGNLDALRARHEQELSELRQLDKNDVAARRELAAKTASDAKKVEVLAWAHELAALTPATTTPLQFAKLAGPLERASEVLGAPVHEALKWAVKIDDLAFSEVVTSDGADLGTLYRLATTNCLKGWPNQPDPLAYMVDANKRMIVTKNAAGEQRRAMLRLVERQDEGHEGQPMLVLERTYPDNATEEEKLRVVEHALRRATEMGIPVAYPLEYYWDSSKTQRRIADMNKVIEDLNRRYHTRSAELTLKVKNRAGNVPTEYIDSAPPTGAAGAGVVGMRHYPGKEDTIYENKFMVLEPK